ncbi:hypothetical protein QJQ45_008554 [Haematococcus lacustris]|nr:hypothetical protein QJQ45_008554 [Haematococcus lacustris]
MSSLSVDSKPFILHGTFSGHRARFLLDSGATGNIVSSRFFQQAGLRMAGKAAPGRLLLPGPSPSYLPTYELFHCTVRLSTYHDRVPFVMADISNTDYDVVLGKPWLTAKNPDIDWPLERITLRHAGAVHTLAAPPSPAPNPSASQLLSPARFRKAARKDAVFVAAGKTHIVPDALSRRPDYQLSALSVATPDSAFFATYDHHAPQDAAYQAAFSHTLSHNPSGPSSWHLRVIDGRLYTASEPPRLYVPASPLRSQLLHEAHDAVTSAHLGRAKTLERLQRHFYWPQMEQTVREYVRTCDQCQRNKATNQVPPGLLQPLPIPNRNWQHVSMDFIGPLPPTSHGYDMVVTVVDKLSKMLHLIPTTATATAPDIAKLFFDHVFKHHGLPEAIVSDRDPKFTSDFWTSLFHLTGTRLLMSSAYHPQTDGQSERANRTVEDMLRPYLNHHKTDWDQYLAAVEFAYNSSTHVGTGFSPFYLNYGHHPRTPEALLQPPSTLVPSPAADAFVTTMRSNIDIAKAALQRAVDKQKQQADKHRRHLEFNVGDKVLLSTATLNLKTPSNSAKLQPRYVGPFKVLTKISPVAYKLDLPTTMRITPTFHISKLRPYLTTSSFPDRHVDLQPLPQLEDGEEYFTIEAILGRRWNDSQHAFQYLVKWKGYDDSFNSWEWGPALAEQEDVAAMIRDYTARYHVPPDKPVDDDPACQICASRASHPPMLLCDKCDQGYHITCLTPPLRSDDLDLQPRNQPRSHTDSFIASAAPQRYAATLAASVTNAAMQLSLLVQVRQCNDDDHHLVTFPCSQEAQLGGATKGSSQEQPRGTPHPTPPHPTPPHPTPPHPTPPHPTPPHPTPPHPTPPHPTPPHPTPPHPTPPHPTWTPPHPMPLANYPPYHALQSGASPTTLPPTTTTTTSQANTSSQSSSQERQLGGMRCKA